MHFGASVPELPPKAFFIIFLREFRDDFRYSMDLVTQKVQRDLRELL